MAGREKAFYVYRTNWIGKEYIEAILGKVSLQLNEENGQEYWGKLIAKTYKWPVFYFISMYSSRFFANISKNLKLKKYFSKSFQAYDGYKSYLYHTFSLYF